MHHLKRALALLMCLAVLLCAAQLLNNISPNLTSLKLPVHHKEADKGRIAVGISVDQIHDCDQNIPIIKPDIVFGIRGSVRRRDMQVMENQFSGRLFAAIPIVLIVLETELQNRICVGILHRTDMILRAEF